MIELRQTILNDFEICPYMGISIWRPLGEKPPDDDEEEYTNKYAAIGIAIHAAMQTFNEAKIRDITLSENELHYVLAVELQKIHVDKFKNNEEYSTMCISAHEQIKWLYGKFHEVKPMLVEFAFNLSDLFEGLPPFKGRMDCICGSIPQKHASILDYKSGKVYTKKSMADNVQAVIYAKAFYKMFGFYPYDFTFYFSKFKKTRYIQITPQFLEQGEAHVRELWNIIQSGTYIPNTKNKFFCKHFCLISKDCPAMKTKKGWEGVTYERFNPEDNVEV